MTRQPELDAAALAWQLQAGPQAGATIACLLVGPTEPLAVLEQLAADRDVRLGVDFAPVQRLTAALRRAARIAAVAEEIAARERSEAA